MYMYTKHAEPLGERRYENWNTHTHELFQYIRMQTTLTFILFHFLPENANFSTIYFILNKAFTGEGGLNSYIIVCPPVRDDNPRF